MSHRWPPRLVWKCRNNKGCSYSSLEFDRERKLPAYARAGISEVWIVNLSEHTVETYREPHGTGYRSTAIQSLSSGFHRRRLRDKGNFGAIIIQLHAAFRPRSIIFAAVQVIDSRLIHAELDKSWFLSESPAKIDFVRVPPVF